MDQGRQSAVAAFIESDADLESDVGHRRLRAVKNGQPPYAA